MKFLVRSIIAMACAAGLMVLIYMLFEKGYLRFNYPSFQKFPIQGIDVSHHQGSINWQEVAKDKIKFAYIKATEGGDFVDKKFLENWYQAKEVGIVRGAYHFFTFCRSGKDQAKNVVSLVPKEEHSLPIAVDLEFGGNCSKRLSREELVTELNSFLEEVKKHHPKKPVFYVTKEFFEHYMEGHKSIFPEHYLWFRNIYSEPIQKSCERWHIWQFSNRGHVKGIKGPVDLNAFCGDQAAFSKLLEEMP